MQELHATAVADEEGHLHLESLPLAPGEQVEVIVVRTETPKRELTLGDLLHSGIVGLWSDREDIGDPVEYARKLRRGLEENLRGR